MVPGFQKSFHLCGKVVPPVFFLVFCVLPPDLEQRGVRADALQEKGGYVSR
jgi:hypothetical protein